MKFKSAILMIILLFFLPISTNANHQISSIEKLDQISDEAFQMVKSSRYEDARKLLDYFSDQFLTYTLEHPSFTMDELRIVELTHNEAVEAMGNSSMNHDERMNRMTKFRLAIDAVTTTHGPLWIEMEDPIMTALNGMKEAKTNEDREKFHTSLNSFLNSYQVIYPSLKLDFSAERIQKTDALVTFIDEYRSRVFSEAHGRQELEALENDLKDLFDEVTEDEADPSLWWVIITTGSIIIVTLSYVGWRKYRGDKEREREKNRV